MYIIERNKNLTEQIKKLKILSEQAKGTTAYESRLKSLKGPLEELRELEKVFKLFVGVRISTNIKKENIISLLNHLQEISLKYHEDPSSILEGNNDYRHKFWEPLRQLSKKINENLLSDWQNYLKQKMEENLNVDNNFLDSLGSVHGFTSKILEIKKGIDSFMSIYNQRNLPTEETINSINIIIENVKTNWSELTTDSFPENILLFFKKVGSNGLNLGDYTYNEFLEIFKWLEEKNLKESFKIVPGGR